jgi:hypothetical protein
MVQVNVHGGFQVVFRVVEFYSRGQRKGKLEMKLLWKRLWCEPCATKEESE